MSLFSSMRVPVAGFRLRAKRMGTIGDNMSNNDTLGDKTHSVEFTPKVHFAREMPVGNDIALNCFSSEGNNSPTCLCDRRE
ncbi:MAG: hypothetical protein LBJ70_05680 [Holosporales bacterium]|jgi:flagellar basal body rod protein FlgC|nr:hypothetical protein [Holosporales bacterium]